MATKSCPSCNEDVPVAASRCKHCFHDFTEEPVKKSNPMVALLGFILVLLVLGGGTFYFVANRAATEKIVVDEETQSVVFTKKFSDRTETNRVNFSEIAKVEHVFGGDSATFEVVAVSSEGKRHIIKQSEDKSLAGYAKQVASIMEKPYEEVKNMRGLEE